MLTVENVIGQVAQSLRNYSSKNDDAAVEEFLSGCTFDFFLCITAAENDVENECSKNLGKGHSFYFPLAGFKEGKRLAEKLHFLFTGALPKQDVYDLPQQQRDEKLYLFLHFINLHPPAISKN